MQPGRRSIGGPDVAAEEAKAEDCAEDELEACLLFRAGESRRLKSKVEEKKPRMR